MSTRITGLPRVVILGALGAFIGAAVAGIFNPASLRPATHLPDAYRVPKIPGGTALRMAMVHDVLHERYLRHGDAWYQQRNRDAQKIFDTEPAGILPTDRALDAMDDLAVGDERLGKYDEGIALMREKVRLILPPVDPVEIKLTGKQWEWKLQQPDGREEINQLHVPVGRAINLTASSEDVVHAFSIPAVKLKMDVLPGRKSLATFTARQAGEFHVLCDQFCGAKHSQMTGTLIALTTEDYAAWTHGKEPAKVPVKISPLVERQSSDDPETDDLQKILAAKNLSPLQHQQYTACANLGTILLIKSMSAAMTGDVTARKQMQESLEWIERAIAINPGGHFGRERWQAILIEHLLAAIDHPEILGEYCFIGESLDKDASLDRDTRNERRGYEGRTQPPLPDDQLTENDRLDVRRSIARVGMAQPWNELVHPDYRQPMPFDEPTLAIIGMWTVGGGPNPHFAVALARIMESVGQRQIAWNAYERAIELQDQFWSAQKTRDTMVDFCRLRQGQIASYESHSDPDNWQRQMRQQHQKELAWGIAYQKEYKDFEARQIAAGVPLESPDFYEAFFKDRSPIASDPGRADELVIGHRYGTRWLDVLPPMIFGIGLGMLLGVIIPERVRD